MGQNALCRAAQFAAIAARFASGCIRKYWEYRLLLFARQGKLEYDDLSRYALPLCRQRGSSRILGPLIERTGKMSRLEANFAPG